jgi:deoxyribodipyrimidine photo-lyase
MNISVLWLRRDLRVHDNPALLAAAAGSDQLLPVFCFDPRLLRGRHASASRTQFLLQSLADLDGSLRDRGSGLIVRLGLPERVLPALVDELGAERVHVSADVGPFARERDARVRERLGAGLHEHPGIFVADRLDELRTTTERPYTVFTPFYRAWRELPRRRALAPPRTLPSLPGGIARGRLPGLEELGLSGPAGDAMEGGERAGRDRMERFFGAREYEAGRETLAAPETSKLSPYLHLGCISARELEQCAGSGEFVRQLAWRDFYAHVLLHFPENAHAEQQERYRGALTYSNDPERFDAWCEGATGFPVIDAAMRQLAREGWMHNRARLLVGSFLTKHLGIDWRWGERWFMRHLIDGDEASNNGNWQWIASVGVDPQPAYRRIYSPVRQQARLDPEGSYVRRYLPELAGVPQEHLPEPWKMPAELQREAGCIIGRDYPGPIVDLAQGRRAALARYEEAQRTGVG